MKLLSRAEEIILLAVFCLKENAYGIPIREFIREKTRTEWSLAQIYEPLNKLREKGYVLKYKDQPTPERGGRHKFLYRITKKGKTALLEIRTVHDRVWESVPKKSLS
ncbi:MAG: helix-turn-helix transcriptional regulator [Candidatus Aminicenantes bacterium]|nr:helix-turn-helix transcriptional regulator [Candidatus Aminicenantes bacterium]